MSSINTVLVDQFAIDSADNAVYWTKDAQDFTLDKIIQIEVYCIFIWDLNEKPFKYVVKIDSVWTKAEDAIERMKYLLELERKIAKEGSHPELNIKEDPPPTHWPEEYRIMWIKNTGAIDPTKGIFCQKTFFDYKGLLNRDCLKVFDAAK